MQSLNSRIISSNIFTELCFFDGCVESIYTEIRRGGADKKETVKSSSTYFIESGIWLDKFSETNIGSASIVADICI